MWWVVPCLESAALVCLTAIRAKHPLLPFCKGSTSGAFQAMSVWLFHHVSALFVLCMTRSISAHFHTLGEQLGR